MQQRERRQNYVADFCGNFVTNFREKKTMNEELKQHVIVHILTINSHKYSK